MKKIATLLAMACTLIVVGCTETKEAIDEYCNWEDECNIRSKSECQKKFTEYFAKAPDFDSELEDMYWWVEGMNCKAWRGWWDGKDVCADGEYTYYGFFDKATCEKDLADVKKAYDHLQVCLESEGVEFKP